MVVNGIPDNMWEDTYKMLEYLTTRAVPLASSREVKNKDKAASKLAADMVRQTYSMPVGILIWILFNPTLWSLAIKLAYWWLFKR